MSSYLFSVTYITGGQIIYMIWVMKINITSVNWLQHSCIMIFKYVIHKHCCCTLQLSSVKKGYLTSSYSYHHNALFFPIYHRLWFFDAGNRWSSRSALQGEICQHQWQKGYIIFNPWMLCPRVTVNFLLQLLAGRGLNGWIVTGCSAREQEKISCDMWAVAI